MHDFTVFERPAHGEQTPSREYAAGSSEPDPSMEREMQEIIETFFVTVLGIMILVPLLANVGFVVA